MTPIVSLPQVDIDLEGEPLPEDAAAVLEEVRVQHRLSQPSLCDLTFFCTRDSIPDLENISIGSQLRLTVPSGSGPLFAGDVTAVEFTYEPGHGQTVHIRAYDVLHRLRKQQPVCVHVQVTPADLARELIADLGLSVEAEEGGPSSQRLIQYRQSSLDLLVDLAQRFGLYLTLRGDVLHLISLGGTGETIALELGKNLLEATIEVNGDPACRSVLARGWDASRVEPHESRADGARIGREVNAEAAPQRFGVTGECTLADQALPDDRHAEAVAQAALDLRIAREVTLRAVADGDPDLMPGVIVDVSGVASSLAGRYVLTSVTHLINRRSGFVSEISTVPPAFEPRQQGATAVWGTVSRLDDPDKLGRVRASLPTLGNVETNWMGVVAVGAGSGKGLVWLPNVGDQVLVLFIGGDSSQAVVLGGLYGVHGPDDYGLEGSVVRRFTLGTSGGQKIQLDDTGECIRLENKGGSFLDLSPKKTVLHCAVKLEIEAPGQPVVIRGKTIDFEQA